MNIFLRGDRSVPMIIAKRLVSKEPKINKTRRFVGFKQGFGSLLYKSIELVQECFWDEEQEVEDMGESEVIQYAVDILDDPGQGAPELIVTKLHGKSRPGCGVYCEVITPITNTDADSHPQTPTQKESKARVVQPKQKRPVMRGQL